LKVLLDTNVVLDILLKREQFFTDSLNAVELTLGSGENKGYLFIPASTITDIYYIANRNLKIKYNYNLDLSKMHLTIQKNFPKENTVFIVFSFFKT